jgi:hypothetical protein
MGAGNITEGEISINFRKPGFPLNRLLQTKKTKKIDKAGAIWYKKEPFNDGCRF